MHMLRVLLLWGLDYERYYIIPHLSEQAQHERERPGATSICRASRG